VRQAVLSGWHRPALQLPPQQVSESTQAWLSAMHALALQRPAVQASEQHSVDDAQPPPAAVHLLIEATQVLLAGSQIPEQQSPPWAQVWLKPKQNGEDSVSPPVTLASAFGVLPSAVNALLSGDMPTFAVLLHEAERTMAAKAATHERIGFGMVAPWLVRNGFGSWRRIRHGIDCSA